MKYWITEFNVMTEEEIKKLLDNPSAIIEINDGKGIKMKYEVDDRVKKKETKLKDIWNKIKKLIKKEK